jgi:hypothetical protein
MPGQGYRLPSNPEARRCSQFSSTRMHSMAPSGLDIDLVLTRSQQALCRILFFNTGDTNNSASLSSHWDYKSNEDLKQ